MEELVATSDGLGATSEEPTSAEEPAMNGLVATVELDEDEAAEQFMTGGAAAAESRMPMGTSCSWRCPEEPNPQILYDPQSPKSEGTRARQAERNKYTKPPHTGLSLRNKIKMMGVARTRPCTRDIRGPYVHRHNPVGNPTGNWTRVVR